MKHVRRQPKAGEERFEKSTPCLLSLGLLTSVNANVPLLSMSLAQSAAQFSLVALSVVLTPGPNMAYLVSRSASQGRRAGLVSLAGVLAAFSFYLVLTCLGLTALLITIPLAFDVVKWTGVLYLLYLAVTTVVGKRAALESEATEPLEDSKLFAMGFLTNLLNPKAALLYLSLLPQFVHAGNGPEWLQLSVLATEQILISGTVNFMIVWFASHLSGHMKRSPRYLRLQRTIMGLVLGGLAVRLSLQTQK